MRVFFIPKEEVHIKKMHRNHLFKMQNTHINQRKVTVEINFLIDFI